MSRPHDGQRTFFPFGNPFRMILPKRSYRSPMLLILNSFEQNLAESLKKIKPKDISNALSLAWMRQAMDFLSETHTNIKALITDLKFPVSNWDEKWVDIYMDTSVKLLDICIALSSELSRLDQGQLLFQYVLHNLDRAGEPTSPEQLKQADACLHDWKEHIRSRSAKLENCSAILQGLEGTLYEAKIKNSAKGKVLMRVLYGVKVVTIYVCSILAAALSGCSNLLMEICVSDKFLWAEAFNDLQGDMNREIRIQFSSGKVTMLKEVEGVELCIERLHVMTGCATEHETSQKNNDVRGHEEEVPMSGRNTDQLEGREKWEECISDLSGRARVQANGLDLLLKQIGDFFQIVLTGRDALLCNLREPDIMEEDDVNDSRL